MQKLNFAGIVDSIVREDSRYDAKAYAFVREGLDYTLKTLKRAKNNHHHVSGQELLEGLRMYTIKEFGPMSKMVLNEWGINKCEDFGQIVFNLVNHGILGKNDNDKIEDFSEIWSFEDAFVKPFEPSKESSLPIRQRKEKNLTAPRIKNSKKSVPKKTDKAN